MVVLVVVPVGFTAVESVPLWTMTLVTTVWAEVWKVQTANAAASTVRRK